jgi:hypothetical protein
MQKPYHRSAKRQSTTKRIPSAVLMCEMCASRIGRPIGDKIRRTGGVVAKLVGDQEVEISAAQWVLNSRQVH